jgi:hypothetical protein
MPDRSSTTETEGLRNDATPLGVRVMMSPPDELLDPDPRDGEGVIGALGRSERDCERAAFAPGTGPEEAVSRFLADAIAGVEIHGSRTTGTDRRALSASVPPAIPEPARGVQ